MATNVKGEVARHGERCWTTSLDKKTNLAMCYGNKLSKFAKVKSATQLVAQANVANELAIFKARTTYILIMEM